MASLDGSNSVEVNKFKRRMIRTVARMRLSKKTEEEMWVDIKNETGVECQPLWERMRLLTMKKLKRLLNGDDRLDAVPKAARMTSTDWLMFNMVLVHEKVDVIGNDRKMPVSRSRWGELKPLTDLFSLVQQFHIQELSGETLAEAWYQATLKYNSEGHQVSPMLLQLRWYQLRECARRVFYEFWFSYRGYSRLFSEASKEHNPTRLQMAVAKRFPEVVTTPFVEWEDMIQKGLAISSETFEEIARNQKSSQNSGDKDDTAPELEVIEPVIETIDLDADSDAEQETQPRASTMPVPELIKVKKEPVEPVEIEDSDSEEVPMTQECLNSAQQELDDIESIDDNAETIVEDDTSLSAPDDSITMPNNDPIAPYKTDFINQINTKIEKALSEQNPLPLHTKNMTQELDTAQPVDIESKVEHTGQIASTSVPNNSIMSAPYTVDLVNEINTQIETGYRVKSPLVSPTEPMPQITSVFGNVQLNSETLSKIGALAAEITNSIRDTNDVLKSATEVPATNFGIKDTPLIVKGHDKEMYNKESLRLEESSKVEVKKEDNTTEEDTLGVPIKTEDESTNIDDIIDKTCEQAWEKLKKTSDAEEKSINTFDMLPADVNLVSGGIELVDDGIAYVDEDMDAVDDEGKGDKDDEQEGTGESAKIDLKLLLYPVVYTTNINLMGLDHFDADETVKDKELLDIISMKSKPVSQKTVNLDNIKREKENCEYISDDDDYSENIIDDTQKVKMTSYLLKKPRTRTYNPISLCKNPDFNTRLKRLNVGFFSSQRNILLLKVCKPLTIDVSKAFESKLVDGTIYLKPNEELLCKQDFNEESRKETRNQKVSVIPTAMPIQSLLDNQNISSNLAVQSSINSAGTYVNKPSPGHIEPNSNVALERRRGINLPDISEIRRLNQRLLTAEVTPIQVQSCTNQPKLDQINNQRSITTGISNNTAESHVKAGPACVKMMTQLNIEKASANTSIKMNDDANIARCNIDDQTDIRNTTKENTVVDLSTETAPQPRPKPIRKLAPPKSVPWYSRETRPNVSWVSRNNLFKPPSDRPAVDEALLTKDTLFKMLFLLTGEEDQKQEYFSLENSKQSNKTKTKKKEKLVNKVVNKTKVVKDVTKKTGKTKNVKKCDQSTKASDGEVNDHTNVQITSDSSETVNTGRCTMPNVRVTSSGTMKKRKENKFCCWSAAKIFKIVNNKPRIAMAHTCFYTNCVCCCKNGLRELEERISGNKIDIAISSITQKKSTLLIDGRDVNSRPAVVSITDDANNPCLTTTSSDLPTTSSTVAQNVSIINNDGIVNLDEDTTPTYDLDSNSQEMTVGAEISVESERHETVSKIKPKIHIRIPVSPQYAQNQLHPHHQNINTSNISENPQPPYPSSQHRPPPPYPTSQHTPPPYPTSQHTPPPYPSSQSPSPNKPQKPISIGQPNSACKCEPKLNLDCQRRITIDGSASCPLHKKVLSNFNSERRLIISSKRNADKPAESPIFLGKNKILLTNIKFPPHISNKTNTEEPQTAKIIPVLPLPSGVQLVLLPTGELTYTLDPDVTLDEKQTQSLSRIIQAVKQQLGNDEPNSKDVPVNSTTADKTQDNVVVDLCDDETSNVDPTAENSKIATQIKEPAESNIQGSRAESDAAVEDPNSNIVSKTNSELPEELDKNIPNAISQAQTPEINKTLDTDTNDTSLPSVTEHSKTSDTEVTLDTSQNPGVNNSKRDSESSIEIAAEKLVDDKGKNILSDLMEMSGISAEDATPAPAPVTRLPEPQEPVPVPEQSQGPLNIPNFAELSPITSLDELKYACAHNGLFFKLDFESGIIVAINVCIKRKSNKAQQRKLANKLPLGRTPTIDLTEDEPSPVKPQVENKSLLVSSYTNKDSQSKIPVKPLRLFKSVHANSLKRLQELARSRTDQLGKNRPTILKKRVTIFSGKQVTATVLAEFPKRIGPMRSLNKEIREREENEKQIEATIDMVDSDCPMEEEYLESINSDDEARKRKVQSDESSDEEPLSNIAKKMRAEENGPVNEDVECSAPATDTTNTVAPIDVGDAVANNTNDDDSIVDESETLNDSNMYEEMLDSEPFDIEELEQDNEDSAEEDCILGV